MPEMPFPSLMQAIALDYKTYKGLRSKIADFRDDGILIYPPDRKGTTLNLPVGGKVAVQFFDEESAYEFYSTVLQRIEEPFISYLLSFPQQVNVIQRRRFYRLKVTNLELNYCLVSQKEAKGRSDAAKLPLKEYDKGKIYDISGSGVAFFVGTNGDELKPSRYLHLQIDLHTDFIETHAQVIRQFSIKDKLCVGTEFVGLEEKLTDRIVAYIFKTQLAERRKLLGY